MLLCRKIEILLALSATSLPHFSIVAGSQADPLSETTQRRADPSFVPYGFQSGAPVTATYENDDSYAGSIAIDHENGLLYLTGGTYSRYFDKAQTDSLDGNSHLDTSDCFVSVLKLPDLVSDPSRRKASSETVPDPSTQPQLIFAQRFGTESNREVCSAVQYLPVLRPDGSSQQKVVSIGHTEGSDGFFTSLRRAGSDISTVYGFVMDFDLSINDNEQLESTPIETQSTLNGGMLFHENKVQYPVAFVSTPPRDGAAEMQVMYVLTMESDLGDVNPDFFRGGKPKSHVHPDLTAGGGGGLQEFGKNFDMTIRKLSWKGDDILKNEAATSEGVKRMMKEEWSRTYSPEGDEDVFASSLLYIASNSTEEDMLIIAGSTRGVGEEFGEGDEPVSGMDGFVTMMKPSSANLFSESSSVRVQSQSNKVDVVSSLCQQENLLGLDEFFVVGYTESALAGVNINAKSSTNPLKPGFQAFLMKMSTSLSPIWTKQLGAIDADVIGLGCAVTPDGEEVYLSGIIKDAHGTEKSVRGLISDTTGSDVIVAKYKTSSGELQFMKEIGTSEDDTLARGGGITVDSLGNAILMGTTRGSLMRWRGNVTSSKKKNDDNTADVFVMSVSRKTGEFRTPMEQVVGGVSPRSSHGHHGGNHLSMFFASLSILICSCLISVVFYWLYKKHSTDKDFLNNNFDFVARNIEDFADIEVEIRHSATGGIHGMYHIDKDDKDDGVNKALSSTISPTDPRLMSASLLKDATFMEDDDDEKHYDLTSKPSNDPNHYDDEDDDDEDGEDKHYRPSKKKFDLAKRRASYNGLVDSYDTIWKDIEEISIDSTKSPPQEAFDKSIV